MILPPLIAVGALVVGLLGMGLTAGLGLPLRPALLLGQIALLAPFWLLRPAFGESPRQAFAWFVPSARGVLLSIACGAALWIAAAGLLHVQYAVWPPPADVLRFFESLHAKLELWPAAQAAFSLLAIAIGPAVSEEIAMRGAILGTLRRPLGDVGAAVASSALFALIHIPPGGYRVPFTFALGLSLAALRLRTGSIVPGVIAHAVLNATTVIATARFGDPGGAPEAASVPAGAAALAFGGVLAAALAAAMPIERERVVHSAE